jgi:integrase
MIAPMPKKLPPYLRHEKTRHGKLVWYVRIGKGNRTRIKSAFDSVEFWAEYEAAIGGAKPAKASPGSFSWGLALYLRSQAFGVLSLATQKQRLRILKGVEKTHGNSPLGHWRRADIVAGRDRRMDAPAAARHFVDACRGLFRWLVESGLVATDPTEGVKTKQLRKGDGFTPWSEEDERKFCERWQIGSRERLAFAILRETGLRRGDAVALGRQHIRDGVIRIKTEKTGEVAIIPVSDALAEAIAATPPHDLKFLPFTAKESFGNWFGKACRTAGLVGKSAHGLRKASATADAYAGWTDAELEAKYAWTGRRMAGHYTRKAQRERLVIEAAKRTKQAPPSPHLTGKEPAPSQKRK